MSTDISNVKIINTIAEYEAPTPPTDGEQSAPNTIWDIYAEKDGNKNENIENTEAGKQQCNNLDEDNIFASIKSKLGDLSIESIQDFLTTKAENIFNNMQQVFDSLISKMNISYKKVTIDDKGEDVQSQINSSLETINSNIDKGIESYVANVTTQVTKGLDAKINDAVLAAKSEISGNNKKPSTIDKTDANTQCRTWNSSGGKIKGSDNKGIGINGNKISANTVGELMQQALSGLGLDASRQNELLTNTDFMNSIIKANPSVFNAEGQVYSDADIKDFDLPTLETIDALFPSAIETITNVTLNKDGGFIQQESIDALIRSDIDSSDDVSVQSSQSSQPIQPTRSPAMQKADEVCSKWDKNGGRLSKIEIKEIIDGDISGSSWSAIIGSILLNQGFKQTEISQLISNQSFKNDTIKANPSVFNEDESIKQDAKASSIDSPSKDTIRALYLQEVVEEPPKTEKVEQPKQNSYPIGSVQTTYNSREYKATVICPDGTVKTQKEFFVFANNQNMKNWFNNFFRKEYNITDIQWSNL